MLCDYRAKLSFSKARLGLYKFSLFINYIVAEMAGNNSKLALLTILAIWISPTGEKIRHFYSCVSEDIKEDAFHACSYLTIIMKRVCQIY